MAFELRRLSVLSYAQGFTFWHYANQNEPILDKGYFDDAGDIIKPGDIILTLRNGEPFMLAPRAEKPRRAGDEHPLDLLAYMTGKI